jgi:hypothetical protein
MNDGLGASGGCMNGKGPGDEVETFEDLPVWADSLKWAFSSRSREVQQRSTATKYSNAIDFDKASLLSNAQIHAQTSLDHRHAPSSKIEGE